MLNFAGRQNNLTKRDNVKQINWGGGVLGGFNELFVRQYLLVLSHRKKNNVFIFVKSFGIVINIYS